MYSLHKSIPKDLPQYKKIFLNNSLKILNRIEVALCSSGYSIRGKSITVTNYVDPKSAGKEKKG